MVSSRRMDGALLLKWRGVAARDRRLGLQHLPLTDLPPALRPESPHSSPRGRGEGRERAPRPGDGDGEKEVGEEEGDSDA